MVTFSFSSSSHFLLPHFKLGKWALLDDDTVTERKEEEVLALSGSGGGWSCSRSSSDLRAFLL
jgi:hypothetical protein